MVRYWTSAADDTLGRDPQAVARRQAERSFVRTSPMLDGMVRLDAELDPIAGATVTAVLDRIERELHLTDQAAGVTRTIPMRRAAALVEMACRATTEKPGRRPRPLFSVVIGDEPFHQLCELADGTVITPGHLLTHLATADIETFLFDGQTVIASSPRRTFTGRLRRAIEVRDRRCQHPAGCDEPAPRCDVDHIVPASHGGPTSQTNGRLGCPPHNRHTLRDHPDTTSRPERPVTPADIDRLRRRWRHAHDLDPHEPAATPPRRSSTRRTTITRRRRARPDAA